ncbi:MAG: hypothetical protein U9R34_01895 [Nanoarchaeota archaeon]|nr:hypothetical protein [Nanoarchaeota archaeon]
MKQEMQNLLDIILRPTTSKKKRKRFAKEFYDLSDYPSILLDVCFDFVLKEKMDSSNSLELFEKVHSYFIADLPGFTRELEMSILIQVNRELIDFYSDSGAEGEKDLAARIRKLNDDGKLVFEFHEKDSIGVFEKHTQYFTDKKRFDYDRERYDFRSILESSDYLILYHGTSSVFDELIEKQGICPPSMTGYDIISKYEQYLDKNMEGEKFERLRQSIENNRMDSVYFSIGRGNIKEGQTMFTNGDVKSYMERAVEMWGGDERLYRCIVKTKHLLPDEDAKEAKNFLESMYIMGSAKIKGNQTSHIFRVKDDIVPVFVNRSPSASRLQELMNYPVCLHKEYFRQNPIKSIESFE